MPPLIHAGAHRPGLEDELVIVVDPAVLDHQRQVMLAGVQPGFGFDLVGDQ